MRRELVVLRLSQSDGGASSATAGGGRHGKVELERARAFQIDIVAQASAREIWPGVQAVGGAGCGGGRDEGGEARVAEERWCLRGSEKQSWR